jgi:DNA polymerase-1
MPSAIKYPRLDNAKALSFDVETKDPDLFSLGPGVYRPKTSHVLGVSLSDGEGFKEYYNIGHYDVGSAEKAHNLEFLSYALGLTCPKIGHTSTYDLDWLENGKLALKIKGELQGVDIAEALLDETQEEYNLDFMSKKYLGEGKEKTEIDLFCEENGLKGDSRKWLWKMPYELVRKYAAQDADLPARIYELQRPKLEAENLMPVFQLENKLVRVLSFMRKTGVKIDEKVRDYNSLVVQNRIEKLRYELFDEYGEFNPNSAHQLARIFESRGIKVPLTKPEPKPDGTWTKGGNPSVNAFFFKRYADEYPLVAKVQELRKCIHHLDGFLQGSHVRFVGEDGLMHAQFFGLKNDSLGALKGTRSGRLSGANPNLQQQPSVSFDEYWGRMCRSDFVPFTDCWWGKLDYSQIEYRFMAHFAVNGENDRSADELREAYRLNPRIDYHHRIMDLTGLKRKLAKNLNFGIAFGMGAPHMAEYFGWELDYAREILGLYHEKAPYVRATMKLVEKRARDRGYIMTFLKRRSRLIDPKKAYTMYCRLVQGSAADLMKSSLVAQYEAGIFDTLPPHMTVHDEVDVSIPKTKIGLDAFREAKRIMENALELRIPVIADADIGTNWADVEDMAEKNGGSLPWEELYKQVA